MVLLNVADIRHCSRVNGPGLRSVVWVQGCTIGCPGCFNPHTHIHAPRRLLDPLALGQHFVGLADVDGLTISGGEPFEQAEACAILAETMHGHGRSVMVFTGYRYDFLRRCDRPAVQRFLAAIDLLVAGPYVQGLPADPITWRGSVNQSVHPLTDRLASAIDNHADATPIVEVTVDGRLLVESGFPSEADRHWICDLPGPRLDPTRRSTPVDEPDGTVSSKRRRGCVPA